MLATTLHPFEAAGLGLAPFVYCGMSEQVYSPTPDVQQPAGSCDYCGMGIRYCCHIRSSDGREFIVGCDCVRKTFQASNRALSDMERDIAKREKAKRDEKRAAEWKAQCEARDAALQAERDRNGGKTDSELAYLKRQQEEALKRAEMRGRNLWLIQALTGMSGDFVANMIELLHKNSVADLSERCVSILQEIYAKSHGRRGSKAYYAACDEFDSRKDAG